MSPQSRFSSLVVACLLAVVPTGSALAQSLRIDGQPSRTVAAAPDYAAEVKGDPWDFDKASDYVYSYSLGNPAESNQYEYTAWQPYPTVAGGIFSGVVRGTVPSLQLLFGGVPGAMNAVQDTGIRYPIDASRYVTLSFRVKRSWAASTNETMQVVWETERRGLGTTGARLMLAKGFDRDTARWLNQVPVAAQGAADQWQVYKLRLTDPNFANRPQRGYGSWQETIRGLALQFGTSPNGARVDLDWVRLTAPRTVRLSWQSLGSNVIVTATDGTQTLQVFPEDLAILANPPNPRESTGTFPDNSFIDWDYGHLTPGTWTITAQGASATRTATLIVDASPFFTVTNPDASGGQDMATTLIGDAWDLANSEDVFRYSTPGNALFDVKNATFTPEGLKATAWFSGKYSSFGSDSQVRFFDDDLGPRFQLTPEQARRYHRLTFTIDYDIPVTGNFDPLAARPFLENEDAITKRPGTGGIMRVLWRTLAHRGQEFAQTCGLLVQDGGPRTYTIDLSAYGSSDWYCGDEGLQTLPAGSAWGNLSSPITNFRLDIHEGKLDVPFTLSNVKLAADDEPDASGQFVVNWVAQDARYTANPSAVSGATVSIYVDDDRNPSSKRLIASNINAAAQAYVWDLGAMPGGLAPGTYWVYVEMTDAAGYSFGKYSTGPLRVTQSYDPPMTLSEWQQFYGITNLAADPDGDGVTNQQEFEAGTSPFLPNRVELAEGSTGFFRETVAIANPESRSAIVRVTVLLGQRDDIGEPAPPPPVVQDISIPAYGRHTVEVNGLPNAHYFGQSRPVSVIVEAIRGGAVVERTMSFGDGWGGHTGKALTSASRNWFLAEGASTDFFQTFILLTATGTTPPIVQVDFLLEDGSVVPLPVAFPAAPGRITLWVNELCLTVPGSATCQKVMRGKSFSTRITSTQPITVERAMYFDGNGRQYDGGHASAGVTEAATRWFVAEGATGPDFDTYLLIANPGDEATTATVRYLTPGGAYERQYWVRPHSRVTLYVDQELSEVMGIDAVNQQVDVSADVQAPSPIVVERAMYWFGGPGRWTDAHNSAGVTQSATTWALAEGQQGGPSRHATFVLIANPSASAAQVRVRLLREGGKPSVVSDTFTVGANSRFTCYDGQPVGCQSLFAQLQDGERFGVVVESVNGVPIVIERAVYWNYGNERWSAGTNETGVKLR